jgi:hypothetical protein
MLVTQDKITSLGKLTALKWGESLNIESVLDSFAVIEEANIHSSLKTTRSGNQVLLPRRDIIEESSAVSDDLLRCSHQKVIGHQIALWSIMHGE